MNQADIDSGKVDPWSNQRDYVAELNRERAEPILSDLISRVRRAMERGAIIMAVPFPDDGGSVESVESQSRRTSDTATRDKCVLWCNNCLRMHVVDSFR